MESGEGVILSVSHTYRILSASPSPTSSAAPGACHPQTIAYLPGRARPSRRLCRRRQPGASTCLWMASCSCRKKAACVLKPMTVWKPSMRANMRARRSSPRGQMAAARSHRGPRGGGWSQGTSEPQRSLPRRSWRRFGFDRSPRLHQVCLHASSSWRPRPPRTTAAARRVCWRSEHYHLAAVAVFLGFSTAQKPRANTSQKL